ncbi:hypothetical protein V6N12_048129 [Hibiscus sabdariffa]|uniref:Uncharacterized protein n=1 Tax=Hibiscus sabdariffa TaxID=183260 RepID=A0ABR2B580_9ROSI
MLLLSQLLLTKERFESCKIQVFCIPEEDSDAEGLKADVKKFLYDLRMQAERVADYLAEIKAAAKKEGIPIDGGWEGCDCE